MVRQSMINWIGRAGEPLAELIPLMFDKAITKVSVVNCDETWNKVRVNGKYRKRYTMESGQQGAKNSYLLLPPRCQKPGCAQGYTSGSAANGNVDRRLQRIQ